MKHIAILLLSLASCFAQSQVSLSWVANPSNPAGVGYNVYRGCGIPGQTFAKLNATAIAVTSYNDASVVNGTNYCYRATATNGVSESAPSSSVDAVIPLGAPSGLTITIKLAVNVSVNGQTTARDFTVNVPEAGQ